MNNNKIPANKAICILQITRFGDLLQTCKAALAMKNEHPEIRLILIAREQFALPLKFILDQTFDKIILLNPGELLKSNLQKDQIVELDKLLAQVRNENISALVNLSFSKTSSYLASLIDAEHKLGPHYDNQANLIIHDKWSQFVYSSVMRGPLAPFNLVDVFKLILGCKQKFHTPIKTKKENCIVVHPFASLPKKQWREHKWGDILYKILREKPDLKIHLVGAKNEKDKADQLMANPILGAQRDRIINNVGKTTIHELATILEKSKIFVGHDSMVSHLAAFYDMPILSIPLGCVRPIETAPYGTNTFVLAPKIKCFPCFPDTACSHLQCHSDIPYQVIYSCVQQLLNHGTVTKERLYAENSHFTLNSTHVFSGHFSNAGLFFLTDIIGDELSFKDLIKVFYRISWLYLLAETEEEADFPQITPSLHQQLLNHMPGLQHIYELAEFGKKYCRFILDEISSESPNINVIKDYSHKIDEIDRLLLGLKNTFVALSPIIDFYTIAKGNISGNNVVELTQHSFLNYNETSSLVSIMYELIEKSITKYKYKSTISNHRSA